MLADKVVRCAASGHCECTTIECGDWNGKIIACLRLAAKKNPCGLIELELLGDHHLDNDPFRGKGSVDTPRHDPLTVKQKPSL